VEFNEISCCDVMQSIIELTDRILCAPLACHHWTYIGGSVYTELVLIRSRGEFLVWICCCCVASVISFDAVSSSHALVAITKPFFAACPTWHRWLKDGRRKDPEQY
jgi:hypothetical protein